MRPSMHSCPLSSRLNPFTLGANSDCITASIASSGVSTPRSVTVCSTSSEIAASPRSMRDLIQPSITDLSDGMPPTIRFLKRNVARYCV